jgi:transcriptional regulator with XRE-family HTH domain
MAFSGERLRQIRVQRGFSQRDLPVGHDTVSAIESGRRNPHPSTLRKLAEALGVEVRDFFEEVDAAPKAAAPPSLPEWLEERCGHAYLARSKEELQELFDQVEGGEDEESKRRELGLRINEEYNVFCQFPKNVTKEERVAMRRMIKGAVSDIAVKHQLALWESGLFPEYQNELERIFEVERAVISDEDIA